MVFDDELKIVQNIYEISIFVSEEAKIVSHLHFRHFGCAQTDVLVEEVKKLIVG